MTDHSAISSMSSRERVMAALAGEQPDRVPYCELSVDRSLSSQMLGWDESLDQGFNRESNT